MGIHEKTDLRILLLEDVDSDAELIIRELRQKEVMFVSRCVQTRHDMMREILEFLPDIILADYKLPTFDGAQALELVKVCCPDVPVIIVSGAVGEDVAVDLLKNGAADFVLKGRLDRLVPAVYRAQQQVAQQRAEAKRAQYSQELQALSCRLVKAQEAERRNIARELHDEIGQALIVLQLNLQWMLQTPGADALTARLMENLKVVERLIDQVHDISLNLRPPVLDNLGLESALHSLAERQADLGGLRADFYADPQEKRLDSVIETTCFRVAQEALTNVVRHAKAKSLSVALRNEEGRLHLRVRDDGIGFDAMAARENAMRGASLGLLSMEERTQLAGGGLEVLSKPGKGTEVHAWFPLIWQNSTTQSEDG